MLLLAEPAATASNPPWALFSPFRWKTKSALEDKKDREKWQGRQLIEIKVAGKKKDSGKGIRRHERRGSNL